MGPTCADRIAQRVHGFTTLLRQLADAPTLLLCTLTVWLPMLPGVWLARREIHLH